MSRATSSTLAPVPLQTKVIRSSRLLAMGLKLTPETAPATDSSAHLPEDHQDSTEADVMTALIEPAWTETEHATMQRLGALGSCARKGVWRWLYRERRAQVDRPAQAVKFFSPKLISKETMTQADYQKCKAMVAALKRALDDLRLPRSVHTSPKLGEVRSTKRTRSPGEQSTARRTHPAVQSAATGLQSNREAQRLSQSRTSAKSTQISRQGSAAGPQPLQQTSNIVRRNARGEAQVIDLAGGDSSSEESEQEVIDLTGPVTIDLTQIPINESSELSSDKEQDDGNNN